MKQLLLAGVVALSLVTANVMAAGPVIFPSYLQSLNGGSASTGDAATDHQSEDASSGAQSGGQRAEEKSTDGRSSVSNEELADACSFDQEA